MFRKPKTEGHRRGKRRERAERIQRVEVTLKLGSEIRCGVPSLKLKTYLHPLNPLSSLPPLPSMPSYKRITFFLNPTSGTHNPALLGGVRTLLSTVGEAYEEIVLAADRPVLARVLESLAAGTDLVAVGGGDGTIREIAPALVGSQVPLAIIPLGTFNNLALSLGIGPEIETVSQLIGNKVTRLIDVGIADDRHHFFEAAGVGFDAELFPIGEALKQGRLEMMWHAIGLAARYRQKSVELIFDRPVAEAYCRSFRGQSQVKHRRRRFNKLRKSVGLRCGFVAIANGPYYGSNFNVSPDAQLDDGLLSISVFRDFSKRELLSHFWSISRGQYHYHPKVELFESAELEVRSHEQVPVHVDGQPIGTTPVRFRVLPKALRVVAEGPRL